LRHGWLTPLVITSRFPPTPSSNNSSNNDVETWVEGSSAQVQSLDVSDLEPGTYSWRVSALDAEGYESVWSHTAHFIYPMTLR
jgi:hypothetical protein